MSLNNTQPHDSSPQARIISEFNYLKITALILLLFVHSDLVVVYPDAMFQVQGFLLSAFFFISGYLAYDSFHRRDSSLTRFFKSKARTLYLPFAIAVIFYFAFQSVMGLPFNPIKLGSQLTMLNIFDSVNSVYNWSSLWFIPYLLLFMLIICLLDKYVKSTKIQLLTVAAVWLTAIMLWVYTSPFRLGELFTQFLLVFAFGFYINKFNLYEKILNYKMAAIALPVVIFFAIDLTYLVSGNPWLSQLYFNLRTILLTAGLVLLALLLLRKLHVPKNGFAQQIAKRSAYIYLAEPFISFAILTLVFNMPDTFFASGPLFYLYQGVRIVICIILVPLGFMLIKNVKQKKDKQLT
ncbi:MAG: acyltransferase [Candidatus Bathyarchaeota archaeon]|nr:acyltransferase [Candidatus Bathyarchaeota archaeon]